MISKEDRDKIQEGMRLQMSGEHVLSKTRVIGYLEYVLNSLTAEDEQWVDSGLVLDENNAKLYYKEALTAEDED